VLYSFPIVDRRQVPALGAALVGMVLLSAPGGRPRAASPAEPSPPRIVLITIDTLRADRLECYGHNRPCSPDISRLARRGVLFHNALTAVPLTLPAHCSIFAGTYPERDGVRDQSGFLLGQGFDLYFIWS